MKDKLIAAAKSIQGSFCLSDYDQKAGSVAAALLTEEGNIYTGICLDLACGIGFCAEHSAIAEMLKHRETKIKMIVAYGKGRILPPCGRCRELMMQVHASNKETEVILSDNKSIKLKELIPHYWNS